jgi:hypothetical protein
MSRQDRCDQAAHPLDERNWHGESTREFISKWSARAHQESDGARHRALSGEVRLHDTASAPEPPRNRFVGDRRAEALADKNFAGNSNYMPGTRRQA